MVEICGFPGVQQHLAHGNRRCYCAHVTMQHPRGRCKPARPIGTNHLWRRIRRTRVETHFAGHQQLTELRISTTVGQHFGEHCMIAAPLKMHAPHFARPFARIGGAPPQCGRVLVRSATRAVLGGPRTVIDRLAMRRRFPRPSARIGGEVTGIRRHGQRHGECIEQEA